MNIRPATTGDAALLLAWRNDPVTRAVSLDTSEVGLAEHEAWLRAKLADRSCEIWIAEDDGVPVAQVRLERAEPGVAVISIAVDPQARGRGYGQAALNGAIRKQQLGATSLRAVVREGNAASVALFTNAGFDVTERGGDTVTLQRGAPRTP